MSSSVSRHISESPDGSIPPSGCEKDSTACYLKRLSAAIMQARNERDYEAILNADYMASTFTIQLDYGPKTNPIDLRTHLREYAEMVEEWPEHRLTIVNATAVVEEMHRVAHIWHDLELTGHPPGVVQKGIGVFEWRKQMGKWMCVKHTGMRRSADFS